MKSRFLVFFACATLFISCKKFVETPEEACFIPYVDLVAHHVNPSSLEVSFTPVTSDTGSGTTHHWDFGDGTTFTGLKPPPHTFPVQTGSTPSVYRVKYTVTNACGEAFWTKDISISSCLPAVSFSYAFLNDSTVEFTNTTQSNTPVTYLWNFGNGATSASAAATVTASYHQDQSYTVVLKATNNCGENNYTVSIPVCRKPVPAQTITASGCGAITIDAGASINGGRFQWDFGNGVVLPATPTSTPTISYTYPANGTYSVKLYVINQSGCDTAERTDAVTITSNAVTPNNNWSYTSDDLEFNFSRETVTGATTYEWNFGNGNISTGQNPNKTFTSPGLYNLTISAGNGCTSHNFAVQLHVPYHRKLTNAPNTGFQDVEAVSPTQIYYLGTNGKLYKSDTAGNWSSPINLPTGISFNSDTRLFKDLNNQLWIYGKKEVAKFNAGNSQWTSYFSSTGFSNNITIESMSVDNNGAIWTIGDRQVRRGHTVLASSGSNQYSSIAFAPATSRMWITSSNREQLYFAGVTANSLSSVSVSAISDGADAIKVASNGELFFITETGIIRAGSTGNLLNSFAVSNTNFLLTGAPKQFELDNEGNIWALSSGRLLKIPVAAPTTAKNYSYTALVSNISTFDLLNLSGTDNDIFLAKTSGDVAVKIK